MRFEAPETVEAAVALLAAADGPAHALSGGTDLLVQMRSGRVEPEIVVDLKRIPAMMEILRDADGDYGIGGAVSAGQLNDHAQFRAEWPGIAEAANLVGSTQIGSRATLAGNLCNASPAADTVPALVAANAMIDVAGPDGHRAVSALDIPTGVGTNALKPGEIVSRIVLKRRAARSADAYLRFTPRTEMDIAVVCAAANLELAADGSVSAARIALGAVAPTVRLVDDAAAAIIGTRLEESALERLGEACAAACAPIDDKRGTVAFRTDVAAVLAKRAVRKAYERARNTA